MVLLEDSHLLDPRDRTFFGIDFTRHDLHQRGFTGAVRPGDRVTPPGDERGVDILEQNAGAEAHGHIIYGKLHLTDNSKSERRTSDCNPEPRLDGKLRYWAILDRRRELALVSSALCG